MASYLSLSFAAPVLLLTIFAYFAYKALYRLYFHPLAKFPGPRLAALTYKYEFYYDGILGGQYTNQIWELHRQLGPIVRINPDELHINDPEYIDEVFAGGNKKRDRFQFYLNQFGHPDSVASSLKHERHRQLRRPLDRCFSKAAVTKLEPMISGYVQKLCSNIEAHAGSQKPIDITNAFSCMTTDVVAQYSFAHSPGFTENINFEPNLRPAILGVGNSGPAIKQWPILFHIMEKLPASLAEAALPGIRTWLDFQKDMLTQIETLVASSKATDNNKSKEDQEGYSTIFHSILDSDLPASDLTPFRISQDAQGIVGAGTETTAWTLAALTFYLLDNPSVLSKVKTELKQIVSDPNNLPPWSTLEQLPYLNATITEGLRLTYGIATRTQRIAREPLVYHGKSPSGSEVEWVIPPNTPVGMTSVLIHQNTDIFPDPLRFWPERWLDENGKRVNHLDKYLFSFTRGSRQCLGKKQVLAYAELYLCLPVIVLRIIDRLELFETTKDDVEYDHEAFIPRPKHGSQGIRVLVR